MLLNLLFQLIFSVLLPILYVLLFLFTNRIVDGQLVWLLHIRLWLYKARHVHFLYQPLLLVRALILHFNLRRPTFLRYYDPSLLLLLFLFVFFPFPFPFPLTLVLLYFLYVFYTILPCLSLNRDFCRNVLGPPDDQEWLLGVYLPETGWAVRLSWIWSHHIKFPLYFLRTDQTFHVKLCTVLLSRPLCHT